jgi:Ca2+/H+ antiporter
MAGTAYGAFVLHIFQSIVELILALVLDVVIEQVLQLTARNYSLVLEIIDADNGQV